MPKPMDTLFIVLSLFGVMCSGGAIYVKWTNDQKTAEARAVAAQQEKEAAERMAEIRLGEMRMLFAARMEAEELRRQVFAQPTVTDSQTQKLAKMDETLKGLDDVLTNALREVSTQTAVQMRRQAEDDAKHQSAVSLTQQAHTRLLPLSNHIVNVMAQSIRGAAQRGLVQITEEKKLPPISHAAALDSPRLPGNPQLNGVRLYEFRSANGVSFYIDYRPGVVSHTGENIHGFGPAFLIYCHRDGTDLRLMFQICYSELNGEMLSMVSLWTANWPTLLPETNARIRQLHSDYEAGILNADALVSRLVVEGIKDTLVTMATQRATSGN